jgi:uncharacterized phage-associated protein
MAQMNGQTPEEIAAEIIKAATETQMIEIDGVSNQKLIKILRYANAKKIYVKGEKWFQENLETLQTEWAQKLINSQHEQREKLDKAERERDTHEYVKLLVARGVNRFVAMQMAGLISEEDVAAAQAAKEAEAKKSEELKKKAEDELAASIKAARETTKK